MDSVRLSTLNKKEIEMTAKKKDLVQLMIDVGVTPDNWPDGAAFAAQDQKAGQKLWFYSVEPSLSINGRWYCGDKSSEFCDLKISTQYLSCNSNEFVTKDQFIAAYNERNKQKEWPTESDIDVVAQNGEVEETVINKYSKEIKHDVFVDVYDVLKAWNVTNPALQHLIKKALQPGARGHKTLEQDIDDIIASAKRAKELL